MAPETVHKEGEGLLHDPAHLAAPISGFRPSLPARPARLPAILSVLQCGRTGVCATVARGWGWGRGGERLLCPVEAEEAQQTGGGAAAEHAGITRCQKQWGRQPGAKTGKIYLQTI